MMVYTKSAKIKTLLHKFSYWFWVEEAIPKVRMGGDLA